MTGRTRLTNLQLKGVVYAAASGIHGQGLFAARDISPGEYIGTFHGPEAQRDGIYVLWVYDADGDAGPIGRSGRNLLRYLNHADPCNAHFDGFDLYALCAIACDQEITIDYGGEL
ncbi:MAG: SET domain-containing protein-lysine N-methyltransferase [Chromatiaceae bacterium]|jgi:hypothetical protein|nr:SET domain-containing protein-lysine N-methyltransferase [Chromatiaceae bacterium]